MIWLFGAECEANQSKETTHRLLVFAVRKVWGWNEPFPLARGQHGKPWFPHAPDHHFNLSHSGPYALCALSDSSAVGVDVEVVRTRRAGLPEYVMSREELDHFDGSWEDFTRIWTLKEAYTKYLGATIWPPRQVPVPPPLPCRSYAGNGWRAALCAVGKLPQKIDWCCKGGEFSCQGSAHT